MRRDIVIGKGGDNLTGFVRDRVYTVESALATIEVEVSKIAHIHYMNPPHTDKDEITLKSTDKLLGTVREESVHFETEGGQELDIPKSRIHTLRIGMGF